MMLPLRLRVNQILPLLIFLLSGRAASGWGFFTPQPATAPKTFFDTSAQHNNLHPIFPTALASSSDSGDKLREATGIRPSLHPVTINALAEALKARAQNQPDLPLRVDNESGGLQVALSAGRIATEAIHKRQEASVKDGMQLTKEEEQTIAGRVVGVVTRLDDLGSLLYQKCADTPWIAKYNEWASFGLIATADDEDKLDQAILDNPLLAMSRAECLLALFLDTVERPGLKAAGRTVPGGSDIDFLDQDRKEVLIQ